MYAFAYSTLLTIYGTETAKKLIVEWKRRRNAYEQIPRMLYKSKKRVKRAGSTVERYGFSANQFSSPGEDHFQRVVSDFEATRRELESLELKLNSCCKIARFLSSKSSVATLSSVLSRLDSLENQLDVVKWAVDAADTLVDLNAEMRTSNVNSSVGLLAKHEPNSAPEVDVRTLQAAWETVRKMVSYPSDESVVTWKDSDRINRKLTGELVAGLWRLGERIETDASSRLYYATNIYTGEDVAVKVEKRTVTRPALCYEKKVSERMSRLSSRLIVGIPRYQFFYVNPSYNMLVMDLLGPNLEDRLNRCYRSMSLKSVLMIGLQVLDRLEYIHGESYVHRNLCPESLLMGNGDEASTLLL